MQQTISQPLLGKAAATAIWSCSFHMPSPMHSSLDYNDKSCHRMILNDSYQTDLCLLYTPKVICASCVALVRSMRISELLKRRSCMFVQQPQLVAGYTILDCGLMLQAQMQAQQDCTEWLSAHFAVQDQVATP